MGRMDTDASRGVAAPVAPDGGFALTGPRHGRTITLTWSPEEGGTVDGSDTDAVAVVQRSAEALEGKLLALPGAPSTTTDHLSSPYTAKLLMQMRFDSGTRPVLTGNLPMLPDPPEGAVR